MKRLIKNVLFLLAAVAAAGSMQAQDSTKSVLFIGNSYTEVNNLPSLVQQVAASTGRTVRYQSNTPGGCTFQQHCSNQSMSLIQQGGWDVVVLQEQSQYPSFPQSQVESDVFPYATQLVSAVYAGSPCAEPMFYMTWGRKNGDAANAQYLPVLATYEGMDSMLYERYMHMKEANDASVSPVGRVWRYLRANQPGIELYASDGSHPSLAGSYAAACTFYVMIFEDSPLNVATDLTLSAATALAIRQAVKQVVYDTLTFWQRPQPVAAFSYSTYSAAGTVAFQDSSQHAGTYRWDFGDSAGSTEQNPTHAYADSGTYTVTLIASRHCMSDTQRQEIRIVAAAADSTGDTTVGLPLLSSLPLKLYPNPAALYVLLDSPCAGTALLYDPQGRRCKTFTIAAGTNRLNLRGLPGKLYTLHFAGNALKVMLR